MSTYSIPTLLSLWRQNEVTAEQAIGYALQHIAALTEQMTDLEKRFRHVEQPRTETPLIGSRREAHKPQV